MALNDTLKTRILLRNDSLANWASSTLVLGKGEIAIATGLDGNLAEVRVGNGTTTWSGAAKLAVDASQISGIVELIQGTSKKYQVVGNNNSWKLQEAALSSDNDWADVSTFTVDFSEINTQITTMSTDLDGAKTALSIVSSDYVKATDFATLSDEIGLSAASALNPVITKNDIADLAGAMHFRGAVTPNEGETDLEALARAITDPASGDVAIITSTSKEYVYSGTSWIELGDEGLYATKAELETLVGTTSAETLKSANAYADSKFAGLSDYYTKSEVNDISTELSTDYSKKIKDVDSGITTAKSEIIGEASDLSSADTINGAKAYAKNYTDEAVAGLSVDNFIKHGEVVQSDLSGFFILDCGGSDLRTDEPTA